MAFEFVWNLISIGLEWDFEFLKVFFQTIRNHCDPFILLYQKVPFLKPSFWNSNSNHSISLRFWFVSSDFPKQKLFSSLKSSNGFWLSCQFYPRDILRYRPICFPWPFGLKTKSTLHLLTKLILWFGGSNGCAIFICIACRHDLR